MREYNIAELKEIIREAYLEVLTENAESSNRKKARRLLKDKKYVTRDNFKAGDEEERIVINTLPDCVRYNHFKFAIFFYSLYYQYKDKVKKDDVWKLINTYFYNILKEEGDNFDYSKYLTNKNDYTLIPLNELLEVIEEYNSNRVEDDNQEYNTNEYPYNGYKIIKILTFKQSKEYSKYCSWCVTKSKQLYNDYTNNGLYCFHYCLRYDYKDSNEPLSMLAVLVDEEGKLNQVTTRANDGDHYYKTEQKVEKHFGIDNFSSVFKSITEEELKQAQDEEKRLKEDYLKNIKQYLKQGHNIEDILKKAYDGVEYDKQAHLFKIENNEKHNYIDKQGNLLFNEWYDNINYVEETKLFFIKNDNKLNYIDKEGNLLFNEWLVFEYNEDLDLFWVENDNKVNYINKQGILLSNVWVDRFSLDLNTGLFKVENDNKVNYIIEDGILLSNEWYDEIKYEKKVDLFKVKNDNEENYIDKQGNLLFNEWFKRITYYDNDKNFFYVQKGRKENIIDKQGNLLSNEWYDWVDWVLRDSNLGLIFVQDNDKYNFIIAKQGSNLIFNEWLDSAKYVKEAKLIQIQKGQKHNFIDMQGNLILNEWYEWIDYVNDLKLIKVNDNNKYNYIDKENNLLFKQWYDDISYYDSSHLFYVKNNNKEYYIDVNENIVEVDENED